MQARLTCAFMKTPRRSRKLSSQATPFGNPAPIKPATRLGTQNTTAAASFLSDGPTPPGTGTVPNTENFDPRRFSSRVYENSTATITRYEPTQVDIAVETSEPGWLVLTDAFTPQWHTFVDGAPAPPYVANTVFRTAYIPAGSHTVSFRYFSPATAQAKFLTLAGLVAAAGMVIIPYFKRRVSSSVAS